MACGDTNPFRTMGKFMGDDDPEGMSGQGLMSADEYRGDVAREEYRDLMTMYGEQVPRQFAVDAEFIPKYGAVLRGEYDQNIGSEMTALDALPGIRSQLINANPETARLLQLLNQQAEGDLLAGSRLTPEDQRYAQQSSRAAMAARGMNASNAGVADEVLRLYDLGQNRLNQRRQFASGVVGLNTGVYQEPMMNYLALSKSGAANRSTGASALLRSQLGNQLLPQVYGENQLNNRATAANETQMALLAAEQLSSMGGLMGGMMSG